jgi:hypothetical protein
LKPYFLGQYNLDKQLNQRGFMTETAQEETKSNDKELNFRKLEAKFEREKEQIRKENEELRQQLEEIKTYAQTQAEDDDDPYIDKKKLEKWDQKRSKDYEQMTKKTVQKALEEERQQMWLKNNSDFQEVMQHADKFAELDGELAETILRMPEGFERQKLVYKTIKMLGLHKPKEDNDVQKQIDQRKGYYYQPSSVATGPYSKGGDFSKEGQKDAYQKMKELQQRLRI